MIKDLIRVGETGPKSVSVYVCRCRYNFFSHSILSNMRHNFSYSEFQMIILFLRKVGKIISVFRILYIYVVLKPLGYFNIVDIKYSTFLYLLMQRFFHLL